MKLCAELGAMEFKEKKSWFGQFLFNFWKNGTDVFKKGIGLHICTPNIHSSPTQGGGASLWCFIKKNPPKKKKKKGFFKFFDCFTPP